MKAFKKKTQEIIDFFKMETDKDFENSRIEINKAIEPLEQKICEIQMNQAQLSWHDSRREYDATREQWHALHKAQWQIFCTLFLHYF